MKKHTILRALSAAALAALLGACSTVTAEREIAPEPSTSSAQAEQRLAAVAAERTAIEARFAEREVVCYDKFFVNRCLDEAKERRRVALLAQRAIEIEASRYLRQAKVEERDRAMAAAEAAFVEEEARLAADPAPAKQAASPAPARKPAAARGSQRAPQNTARAEPDGAERAANVAAYEDRRRKSEQRQKEVARRVAEREAKAARNAADAAAKKNQVVPLQ